MLSWGSGVGGGPGASLWPGGLADLALSVAGGNGDPSQQILAMAGMGVGGAPGMVSGGADDEPVVSSRNGFSWTPAVP